MKYLEWKSVKNLFPKIEICIDDKYRILFDRNIEECYNNSLLKLLNNDKKNYNILFDNDSSIESYMLYSIYNYLNMKNKEKAIIIEIENNKYLKMYKNGDIEFNNQLNNINDESIITISNKIINNKQNPFIIYNNKEISKEEIESNKIDILKCNTNIASNVIAYPELITVINMFENNKNLNEINEKLCFPLINIALNNKDFIPIISSLSNNLLFKKVMKKLNNNNHLLNCIYLFILCNYIVNEMELSDTEVENICNNFNKLPQLQHLVITINQLSISSSFASNINKLKNLKSLTIDCIYNILFIFIINSIKNE